MKVILIQDVKNLGKKNDIVTVSDGYFKNFLKPKQLAVIHSNESIKHLNEDLLKISQDHQKQVDLANKLKQQIEKVQLEFSLKQNKGNVFGSISEKQIITSLKQKGIEITKFMFPKDFNGLKIGKFDITLTIFEDVKADLSILITEEK